MGDVSKHFSRHEFACECGCGFACVDVELLSALEGIRETFGPVTITGPNRCEKHNKEVGGAPESMHPKGMACDFKVVGVHEDVIATYLESKYPTKYGIGRYKGRTHIDVRPNKARWDNR